MKVILRPNINALAVWKRLLPDTATFVPIQLDGRRSRLLADLSLEIINIRERDSGIYFCFSGSKTLAKYAVDVVREEPHRYVALVEIFPNQLPKHRLRRTLKFNGSNVVLNCNRFLCPKSLQQDLKEQRMYLKCCLLFEKLATEAYQMLQQPFKMDAMTHTQFFECLGHFKRDEMNLLALSGCPSSYRNDETSEKIHQKNEDRRFTIEEISEKTRVNWSS
ncbi:uncharacterized protein NPIL_151711 [Nephila pilipes]|uniref:Uncharacterized protein n=1 Tax=Nephila pilipes TaxID=299642 RepID=A0A8X6P4T0_NEPPI|nr:uncharacterized protein NPIL_151711 [Nephila pilipes]